MANYQTNSNAPIKAALFFAVMIITAAVMLNAQTTGFAPLSGAGSGLVAHYAFDEGSGTTAADSSGSGKNATLVGSASWAAGKSGQALSVSGSSRAAVQGDIIGTGPATICAWINPSTLAYLHSIISTIAFQMQAYNTGSGSSYSIYLNNNQAIWQNSATSAGGISPGQWTHVCAVRQSSGNTTFYVNGVQSGTPNKFAGTPVDNYGGVPLTQTAIGADPNGNSAFTGSIDEVRIYNRELSAQEVQDMYTGTVSVPDTQAPSTPTGLNATATAQNQIDISWNDSTDNIAVTGYKIYRNGTQVGTSTSTTYSDTGLSSNTTYNYKVAANDAAGNTSAQSTQASATTFAPDTQAPTTPTGLSASAVSSSQINLSWNPSSDNVIVTGYKIYRGGTQIGTSTSTSYTDSGLLANTSYSFTVAANDAAGNTSAQSASASATTQQAQQQTGALIPADRLVSWTPGTNVGVLGGIPTNRTKCATTQCQALENASAAYKNGSTEATTLIQQAIDSAPENTYVYIPAGTWMSYGNSVVRYHNNITIRGSGEGTIIDLRGTGKAFYVGDQGVTYQWPYPSSNNTITSGFSKGTTQITIGDASPFPVGEIIQIKQDNDPNLPVVYVSGNVSVRTQKSRIVSKSGNTLTIFPGLYWDYSPSLNPKVNVSQYPNYQVDGVGLEDMRIDATNADSAFVVVFERTYGSWIKNVHTIKAKNYHVYFKDCLNCELRHSNLDQIKNAGTNGAGLLVEGTSASLFEDNIIYKSFPLIEVNYGSSGNVFAYNFLEDSAIFGIIGKAIVSNHGPHNSFNLYEGNIASNLQSDGYFGSNSHDTVFRNWFHGTAPGGITGWTLNLNRFTRAYSVIGNVFGKIGVVDADNRFGYPNIGNFDYTGTAQASVGDWWDDWGTYPGQNGFQEMDLDVEPTTIQKGNYLLPDGIPAAQSLGSTTLPNSLYLSSKPAWFGSLSWPAINPSSPSQNFQAIPAGYRYFNNGSDPPGIGTTPTCTSFTYSAWGVCTAGTQARTVLTSSPSGCVGGTPVTTQSCTVANNPPTASITSPANNTTLPSPPSVIIFASASDSDGAVSKVEFFNGAALIATLTLPPYTTTLTAPTAGTYTFTAKATDNLGATTTSSTVTLTITQDTTAPVISNGQPTGTLPSTITQTTLSINTNEPANCKYTTIQNTTYNAMGLTLTPNTPISTTHTATITGLQPSRTYTYYTRCADTAGNANNSDYTITFSTAAPSPVNGSCGATNNACTQGTLSDMADNTANYLWNCNGTNGGTNASCSIPKPVNGACGTTLNACTQGTLNDTADNTTNYLWNCNGTNGGTIASCTLTKPVNGTCGSAAKAYSPTENFPNGTYCTNGNPTPTTPANPTTTTPSTWTCNGTNGGTTSPTCTATRTATPINGTCAATPNTCTTGTLNDLQDSATDYLWNCNGINGGTNANCTQPKPPPTVADGTTLNITLDTPLQFTLSTPSTYKLTGTVIAADGGENSAYIDIDSNPGTGAGTGNETKAWAMTITTTTQEQEVNWNATPKTWTLTSGNHTLYVNTREAGTIVSAIKFTNLQPVNGVCSTTLNTCNNGTFTDATDTATTYNWNCNGANGGTNASCSSTKPPAQTDADGDGVSDLVDKCPTAPLAASQINSYGCPLPIATKFDIKPDFENMDLNNVTNFEIGISNFGKITYTNTHITLAKVVNGTYTPANLDQDINITRGLITVNADNVPELNQPVAITLYNIKVTNPKIKRNGIICTECQIISNTNNTLIFTVPGF